MSSAAQRALHVAPLQRSPLTEKLMRFGGLDPSDRTLLQSLEQSPRTYGRRKIVHRQGEEADALYVLRSGWAFTFAIMPDGGRQVLHLHFPGDIIGLSSLGLDRTASGLATATHCELSHFPRAHLAQIARRAPRLGLVLQTAATIEQTILVDRLKSVGRMEARDRVALFLLQVLARLELAEPGIGDSFLLPLSQELIGDAVGLSSIHVNRTLRRLEEEGQITRRGQEVTLPDRERLAESVNFVDRYTHISTDWFASA